MKAGTTALADFLDQHPEICVSVPKEPGYFATDKMRESDAFHGKQMYFKTRTPAQYAELFDDHSPHRVDASTAYIYSEEAAENIARHNPAARIIILLRNPAGFCHSLHEQYLNETVEDETDFNRALHLETDRKQGKQVPSRVRVPSYLYYSERLRFHTQVSRYLNHFPRQQILFLLHDDFQRDNATVYARVLKFMGVENCEFEPDFRQTNVSRAPRSSLMHSLVNYPPFKNVLYKILGGKRYTKTHKALSPLLMKPRPRNRMEPKLEQELFELAKPELQLLSDEIGIDLVSRWQPGSATT